MSSGYYKGVPRYSIAYLAAWAAFHLAFNAAVSNAGSFGSGWINCDSCSNMSVSGFLWISVTTNYSEFLPYRYNINIYETRSIFHTHPFFVVRSLALLVPVHDTPLKLHLSLFPSLCAAPPPCANFQRVFPRCYERKLRNYTVLHT